MSLNETKCLMMPGPVAIPSRVLTAMSRQMVNRRGPEFTALFRDVTTRLRSIYHTTGEVLLFPASGSGGLEAAVVNTLQAGDRVLTNVHGLFSERFDKIARTFGMDVQRLDHDPKLGIDLKTLTAALAADTDRKIKAVLVTHNETATGVCNDLASIGAAVHAHGALLLVDAVSSLGGIEIRQDDWHLDVVVSASQKALFSAAGVAMISVSDRAWAQIDDNPTPRYFFDLRWARDQWRAGNTTPYTPAMTTLYGMLEALKIVEEEGFEHVLGRHRAVALAIRAGVRAMGLQPYAADEHASWTVTTILNPAGVDPAELRQQLKEQYHVVIAGGLPPVKADTFRIGHLGYIGRGEVMNCLSAMELGLNDLGFKVPLGSGVTAAQKVFATEL